MTPLIKGIILGLALAAPVGPIGILCIRKTLNKARWIHFWFGCGNRRCYLWKFCFIWPYNRFTIFNKAVIMDQSHRLFVFILFSFHYIKEACQRYY